MTEINNSLWGRARSIARRPFVIFGGLIALGAVLAVVFGVSLNSHCGEINRETAYHQSAEQQEQYPVINSTATINFTNVETQKKLHSKQQHSNIIDDHLWGQEFICGLKISDLVTMWLTWCLVVVGGFQAWWLFETLKATDKTAEVTKSDLLVGQRAYVYVSFQPSVQKNQDTGNVSGWGITPIWQNFGSTPTRNMHNHISVKVFDGPIPLDWDFPDLWDKKNIKHNERTGTLLPVGPHSIIHGQSLHISIDNVRESVAPGTKTIYVWGWAKYEDVFPLTPKHVTRFCNRVVITGDPTNPEKCSISFPLHTVYNCADDECMQQGFPASWDARQMEV
jgi:hypothetical protein